MKRPLLAMLLLLLSMATRADSRLALDLSGLWWNPQESGWAASVTHQGDTLFVALLVHGHDGLPAWLMASNMRLVSNDAAGASFTGALHRTSGPPSDREFDPARVTAAPVGILTLAFERGLAGEANTARLEYSVDGTVVTKLLSPYAFREPFLGRGPYRAMLTPLTEGCVALPQPAGVPFSLVVLDKQPGSPGLPLMIVAGSSDSYCEFEAQAKPFGRLADINGTYQCFRQLRGTPTGNGTFRIVSGPGFAGGLGWVAPADQSCRTTFGIAVRQ